MSARDAESSRERSAHERAGSDLRFLFELGRLRIDDLYGDYALALFDPDGSVRLLVIGTKG